MLSGYLITKILLHDLRAEEFGIAAFYRRRIRRIFPALGVICLACLVGGWFLLFSEEYTSLAVHTAAGAMFVSNLLFWSQTGYFDAAAEIKPLLHLWSLAVEAQFYMVWPLLILSAWRRRRNIFVTIACAGGLSFVANGALFMAGNASADFYARWARFWEFAASALLASQTCSGSAGRWKDLQGWIGFFLLIGSFFLFNKQLFFPGVWALVPVIGACLVLRAGTDAWINRAILGHPAVVGLGLLSFPLYLWHWPLIVFAKVLVGAPLSDEVTVALLLTSLAFAWMTFHFVENNTRHVPGKKIVPVLLVGFMILVYLSALIYLGGGYPDRAVRENALVMDGVAQHESRHSDGSCTRLLRQVDQKAVVCRSHSATPRVMFVGDSHAMALYSATLQEPSASTAMLVAWHSCPLYPNFQYTPKHGNFEQRFCSDMARVALDMVSALPSIEQVVLVNFAYDVDDMASDYSLNGKTLSRAEAFSYGTEDFIRGVLQAGKKPVILLDVPHLRRDPNACVARFSFISDKPECRISLREHENVRSRYRDAVTAVSSRNPGLTVYDAAPTFCEGGDCQYRLGNQALYYDTHHLSPLGASLLLNRMRLEGVLKN